eukprot:6777090-Alexandrium_andersonii.AAC.1
MEVCAAWHPALSDHACLTTCPAAVARRAQDCPPRRLRGLPQAARFGVAAADEALHQPRWQQKAECG